MIAVVVENIWALLTLASLYAVAPDVDPYVVYIGKSIPAVDAYLLKHGHSPKRTGLLPSYEIRTLHIALREMGERTGYVMAFRGGMVMLRDPRPSYPAPEKMANYSTGIARRYMYGRHIMHHRSYRALGINVKDNRSNRTTYHRLDVPYSDVEYLTLTPTFYYGHDPLLRGFMSGRELLKHALAAEQSCVIDLLAQAKNPKLTLMDAYAEPLEHYQHYAMELADYLPSDEVAVICKNGRRSALMAPARKIVRPMKDSEGENTHENG